MSSARLSRLRDALGAAELSWILERLRRRLEQGKPLTGFLVLDEPTPLQREAVGRLFGTDGGRGASIRVDLAQLEGMLVAAGACSSLHDAVEKLVGPVEDIRARRANKEAQWERLFGEAEVAGSSRESIRKWVAEMRRTGLLRRAARGDPTRARELLERIIALDRMLPLQHNALAEVAAMLCGDAHALDIGEPLGTLALRLLPCLTGLPVEDDSEGRREAWAAVGVICDELSAPVLTLNLVGLGSSATEVALAAHAGDGEPYRLSTRQLLRRVVRFAADALGRVFICENPSVVVAAANRLGRRAAPMVCTEGMPRTSAHLLLSQLAACGVALSYHGDFDWPGLRIANLVIERYGARPWRLNAADYDLAAVGGTELLGEPAPAAWDAELMPAMRARGVAVHEERVLDTLLDDLARR